MTLLTLPARARHRVAAAAGKARLERDFRSLIATGPARRATAGPTIGVATFGSGCGHLVLESLLAHALERRGARAELLICDLPELPVCDERTAFTRGNERCRGCIDDKRAILQSSGLRWRGVRSLVDPDALRRAEAAVAALSDAELDACCYRGWPIGRWLHVSACHFLRCDASGDAPEHLGVRRRLLVSAMVVVDGVDAWLDALQPDVVIAESGAHFMWRIALELARARGIRVVCREVGKGGWDRHIYAINRDAMNPDLDDVWARASVEPLTAAEDADVDRYLDHLPGHTYRARPSVPRGTLDRAGLGVPATARIAVAFSNVTWDLATAGRDAGYNGVADWLRHTIACLSHHPDVHLIVRAHPAEASVLTGEHITQQLLRESPAGWPRVTLVPPEAPAPAPDLIALADVVLAYNSTAGLEAAARGTPVVVCGRPHYRGKGFTIDMNTRHDHQRWLEGWAGGAVPAAPDVARARRYAHLFFLRYHLAMNWTTSPIDEPYRLTIRSMSALEPGVNPALDVACDGILHGTPIVMPRVGEREA